MAVEQVSDKRGSSGSGISLLNDSATAKHLLALRLIDVLAEVASMTCFLGVVLAAVLISQAKSDQMVSGDVVDSQGKPVADARVVFYAPPVGYLKGDPVEVQATTDGAASSASSTAPGMRWAHLERARLCAWSTRARRRGRQGNEVRRPGAEAE